MIEQFATLCRVKELHEQNSLRTLRAKRTAVEKAQLAEDDQRSIAAQSAQTLPDREAALFDAIMKVAVTVHDIDETKHKALKLREDHQALADEVERRVQIRMRCEKERDQARAEYQMAQRNLDKFNMIKSDLETQQLLAAEEREELEIEDLFSKGQALPT